MVAGLSAKTKIKTKSNIKRAILIKLMALIFYRLFDKISEK